MPHHCVARLVVPLAIAIAAVQISSCSRQGQPTQIEANSANQNQPRSGDSRPDPYADIPDRQPVMHRTAAGDAGPDGWCLAESTRGAFSVMLPGKFNDSMLKMGTTTGGTSIFHTVLTKTADGADFNATRFEIIGARPPGSPAEMIVHRFRELGGKIVREEIVLAGLPGTRMHVEAQGTTADMVLITTPSNEYMLAVQILGPISPSLQQDVERFLHRSR